MAPAPSPSPTAPSTAGDASEKAAPGSDDGGLLDGSLAGLVWDHPWVALVALVAALVGVNVAWGKFRAWRHQQGKPTRMLGPIVRDVVRFIVKEDRRPLTAKLPWLLVTKLYLILFLAGVVSVWPGLPSMPPGMPWALLALVAGSRYSKVAKARFGVVSQMFAVANGECRYPRGAELNPWAYVQVTHWTNLIQPGQTIVTIPAAYQSEELKTRERFERNFNGTVSEENAWTYKWESAKNRIVCQPAAFLPDMAPYPGPGPKWDEIPVGVVGDGSQAVIPLTLAPHSLVCGPTGTGKSVLQRTVLFHLLAHSDTWRIVAIDMKRVEMSWLKKYPQVLKVATDLEEAVEVLRSLRDEMMRRYEEMEENGVNHAKDLPNPPKAIFCMIDESTVLLATEGNKSDEGKERDQLHMEAGTIIGELGRLSRASMIHVMACFQRPDAAFLKGETKANFDVRIAAGRMDTTPSLMVLDSEGATRLPKIKGRGMIRIGGELDTFQGYFAEQSWFDDWLAAQQAPEPAPESAPTAGPEEGASEAASAGKSGRLRAMADRAAARAAAARVTGSNAAPEEPVGEPSEDAASSGVALGVGPSLDEMMQPPTFDDEMYDDFDLDDLGDGSSDDPGAPGHNGPSGMLPQAAGAASVPEASPHSPASPQTPPAVVPVSPRQAPLPAPLRGEQSAPPVASRPHLPAPLRKPAAVPPRPEAHTPAPVAEAAASTPPQRPLPASPGLPAAPRLPAPPRLPSAPVRVPLPPRAPGSATSEATDS